MKRSEKEAIIADVSDKASRAVAIYIADFTGITAGEETELRREFRKAGVAYNVVKNTLAKRALQQLGGYDCVVDKLAGPTGIAYAYDDPAAPARIIKKFSEKTGKLKLKVAVIEKQLFDASRLDALANMPTRKDIMTGIVGSLQSPISGIMGCVDAVIRDLILVIEAIGKKK